MFATSQNQILGPAGDIEVQKLETSHIEWTLFCMPLLSLTCDAVKTLCMWGIPSPVQGFEPVLKCIKLLLLSLSLSLYDQKETESIILCVFISELSRPRVVRLKDNKYK
jgi:hypothetical protein